MQRRNVIEKIVHLQDEVGNTIHIPRPCIGIVVIGNR